MKKTIVASAISGLLATGALLYSCQKTNNNLTNPTNPAVITKEEVKYGLDAIPNIQGNENIETLLVNEEDKDDEKINRYKYEILKASEELFKDKNFNKSLIETAKSTFTQTANLVKSNNRSAAYFSLIDEKLKTRNISLIGISNDFTHKAIADAKRTIITEKYEPAIFIPNLEKADFAKQPIFSSGLSADCEKNPKYEDYLITWYFTESGEKKEVLISEETAMKTTNPIFIIDNVAPEMENRIKQNALPPVIDSRTRTEFHSNEYKLMYNYEPKNEGASEFHITAFYVGPGDTQAHWVYNAGDWQITQVPRRDIGFDQNCWRIHCQSYLPYDLNFVYWNTFERDWTASAKNLGHATPYGVNIYLSGNMSYNGDWYAWDPDQALRDHFTPTNYIYNHWASWQNSWKSTYRIWRVEL